MPSFLVVTGFLVNVGKPVKAYALYLSKIALAYVIMVSGYAALSLFLPVRDGLTQPTWQAFAHVLFIKSIGPYWFLHLMVVCGVLITQHFVSPQKSAWRPSSLFSPPSLYSLPNLRPCSTSDLQPTILLASASGTLLKTFLRYIQAAYGP